MAGPIEHKRMLQLFASPASWASSTLVPLLGEVCIERVSSSVTNVKIGDGSRTFPNLPYVGGSGSGVQSFNGRTGVVMPLAGDFTTATVAQVTDRLYMTGAERVKLGNLNVAHEVPSGGNATYVLTKNTGASYDFAWLPSAGGSNSGASGIWGSDYGLIFDGATDQTNELNTVLDAAEIGAYVRLYSPSGNPLRINGRVRVPSYVTLDLSQISLARGKYGEVAIFGGFQEVPLTNLFRLYTDAEPGDTTITVDFSPQGSITLLTVGSYCVLRGKNDGARNALQRHEFRITAVGTPSSNHVVITIDPPMPDDEGTFLPEYPDEDYFESFGITDRSLLSIKVGQPLDEDTVPGQDFIEVATPSSFTVGSVCQITDSYKAKDIGGTSNNGIRDELVRVKSIDGGRLYFQEPIERDYLVSRGAALFQLRTIKNARIIGAFSEEMLQAVEVAPNPRKHYYMIAYAEHCHIEKINVNESSTSIYHRGQAGRMYHCIASSITDSKRIGPAGSVAQNSGDIYAFSLYNCSDSWLEHNYSERCRHGALDQDSTRCTIAYHRSHNDLINGCDAHGLHSVGLTIHDCEIVLGEDWAPDSTTKSGMTIGNTSHMAGDQRVTVRDCQVTGVPGTANQFGMTVYPPAVSLRISGMRFSGLEKGLRISRSQYKPDLISTDLQITNCRFENISKEPIDMDGGQAAWTTGATYNGSSSRPVYAENAGRVYRTANSGIAGATPPTHSSGTVSDGTLSWLWVTNTESRAIADALISNNHITRCKRGMVLRRVSRLRIYGNIIENQATPISNTVGSVNPAINCDDIEFAIIRNNDFDKYKGGVALLNCPSSLVYENASYNLVSVAAWFTDRGGNDPCKLEDNKYDAASGAPDLSGGSAITVVSSSGNALWGGITGTLSAQTDLNSALALRILTSARGAASGVASLDSGTQVPVAQIPDLPITKTTGLQAALDVKASTSHSHAVFNSVSPGFVPLSGTPTGKFLKDDGTFDVPSAVVGSVAFSTITGQPTDNTNLAAALAAKATYASPAFTGTPTGPTAAALTNTTQLATTAFVDAVRALQIPLTQKGAASGVATLDSSSLVPLAQIPALTISKTTGLQAAIDAKSDTTHIHAPFTSTVDGFVDAPGTVTGKFLKDDGTWAVPAFDVGAVSFSAITGQPTDNTNLATALNAKSPLASPAFTGTPTAPTASPLTNTTQLATTAFVDAVRALQIPATQKGAASGVATLDGSTLVPVAQIPSLTIAKTTGLQAALDAKAALVHTHATFTASVDGFVAAPVTATGKFLKDNGTWDVPAVSVGSVAFSAITGQPTDNTNLAAALALKAALASPAFTGTPTAPTAAAATNTTQLATTAFVDAARALLIPLTQRGAASGVATLDASTLIPDAQIPQLAIAKTTGLQAALDAKAAVSHIHAPFTSTVNGFVTAPTTVTGKYLKDDGTWGTPPGSGGGSFATLTGVYSDNASLAGIIATLAPLASAAFTGTPTAPTAAAATSTTQIATTAFVTAADALLIPLTQKGAVSGVATLDASTLIPIAQIPALTIAKTTGLQAALDAKAALVHTHADATTTVAGFMPFLDKVKLAGWLAPATGSPEGVYVGSPGNIYVRTDGVGPTLFYIKQTGVATNTGWLTLTDALSTAAAASAAAAAASQTSSGIAANAAAASATAANTSALAADATYDDVVALALPNLPYDIASPRTTALALTSANLDTFVNKDLEFTIAGATDLALTIAGNTYLDAANPTRRKKIPIFRLGAGSGKLTVSFVAGGGTPTTPSSAGNWIVATSRDGDDNPDTTGPNFDGALAVQNVVGTVGNNRVVVSCLMILSDAAPVVGRSATCTIGGSPAAVLFPMDQETVDGDPIMAVAVRAIGNLASGTDSTAVNWITQSHSRESHAVMSRVFKDVDTADIVDGETKDVSPMLNGTVDGTFFTKKVTLTPGALTNRYAVAFLCFGNIGTDTGTVGEGGTEALAVQTTGFTSSRDMSFTVREQSAPTVTTDYKIKRPSGLGNRTGNATGLFLRPSLTGVGPAGTLLTQNNVAAQLTEVNSHALLILHADGVTARLHGV